MSGLHSTTLTSVRGRLRPASLPVVPEDASLAVEAGCHKRSSQVGSSSGMNSQAITTTENAPRVPEVGNRFPSSIDSVGPDYESATALSPVTSPPSGSGTEQPQCMLSEDCTTTSSSSGETMKRSGRRTMPSLATFKWPARRSIPQDRTTNKDHQRDDPCSDAPVLPQDEESEHQAQVDTAPPLEDRGRSPSDCTTPGLVSPVGSSATSSSSPVRSEQEFSTAPTLTYPSVLSRSSRSSIGGILNRIRLDRGRRRSSKSTANTAMTSTPTTGQQPIERQSSPAAEMSRSTTNTLTQADQTERQRQHQLFRTAAHNYADTPEALEEANQAWIYASLSVVPYWYPAAAPDGADSHQPPTLPS